MKQNRDANITKDQVKAALRVTLVVGEAIKEAGPEGIAAGPLYAMLGQFGVDFTGFTSMVNVLKNAGAVKESGNVLRWVGGAA